MHLGMHAVAASLAVKAKDSLLKSPYSQANKMAPLNGDTISRALIISLFLSFFVVQTFGVLVYTREELLVINSRCGELTNEESNRLNFIGKYFSDNDSI